MEEKRDKRIGKSGHLWLSARRKKRKATAAIAYQQERKKRRLEEISTFPEEVTWTLTSSGNENDDSSAPGTSQTESGIFNLITQKELMHEAAASQHTEENLGQHNHADLEHECDVSEDEVLSTKLKTMSKNIPEVEEVLQEDGIHTKTYAVLKQLSPIFVNSLEAQDYETNTENLHSLDHLSVTSITSHGQVSNTDSDELGYLRESACNYEEDSNIKSSDKTEMCPTTTIETDFVLEGHRIVDIGYVLMKLVELGNHNAAFGCSLNNMKVFKEIRRGLSSVVLFRCNMCNGQFSLHTHDPGTSSTHMDINARAVAGVMSIGGGFSHLEELSGRTYVTVASARLTPPPAVNHASRRAETRGRLGSSL
ncbi:uncharacterized protein LOC134528840 [Bacillus rossius redtenbacheri]|uniref:uncharacterized protein LOC134528840 n=1 Tax=Bacillus rossius redtenbacheri TaxID=93214 RepID=UPI002FDE1B4D